MRVKGITQTGISLPSHLTSCELATLRRVFVNSYGGVTVKRRLRRLKYTVSGISPQYIALLVNRTYFTLLNISQAKRSRPHLEVLPRNIIYIKTS